MSGIGVVVIYCRAVIAYKFNSWRLGAFLKLHQTLVYSENSYSSSLWEAPFNVVYFFTTGLVSNLKRKRSLNVILILQLVLQTNFLHPFSSLKPLKSGTHPKQRSISRGVILCWLGLLVNVTFFSDGQQGVVKTPGTVEALLDLSTTQAKQIQEKAILVLRNLCFHGASKPVLLVNGQYYWDESRISHFVYCWKCWHYENSIVFPSEKLLSLLVDYTSNTSTYLRALCLSALCALVHNCQKVSLVFVIRAHSQ